MSIEKSRETEVNDLERAMKKVETLSREDKFSVGFKYKILYSSSVNTFLMTRQA